MCSRPISAPTPHDLIAKLCKAEGIVRQPGQSKHDLQRLVLPLYAVKIDAERNRWVATRKECAQ